MSFLGRIDFIARICSDTSGRRYLSYLDLEDAELKSRIDEVLEREGFKLIPVGEKVNGSVNSVWTWQTSGWYRYSYSWTIDRFTRICIRHKSVYES